MQTEHVGNFGTQFDRGTLVAAGPLGDNGTIRGTVILAVHNSGQIAGCFKPDPFVQNDILAVEAHPWLVDVMKFGTPKVPFQLARHTLCIVKKGTHWKAGESKVAADSMLRLLPTLRQQLDTGESAIYGPFADQSDKLGVLLFYSSNQMQIQVQLEQEPLVRDEAVELEFHPQFLGKGTLRDPLEAVSAPGQERGLRLFDGRTLAGWEGDTQHTWRVENGAIIGGSLTDTVPRNDFLCATRQFTNFDLRLKARLGGTGFVNGGIQIRSQRLKDPAFEMAGYQADMGEGYWGSLYDESRRNRTLAHTYAAIINRVVRPNDWNDYVIRCEGSRIRLWLNGVLTVDYTEDDMQIPSGGLIGLQIHGGGKAQASYKDITIQELP
jgi:3-keto-disaccharide hydrolase